MSELPEALRLHILSFMPLKSAIRTGALSSRWRNLWTQRWPQPSSLYFFSPPPSLISKQQQQRRREESAASDVDRRLKSRGLRRLDCFALYFHQNRATASDLKRWLDYAAACSVEDLHIDLLPSSSSSSSFPSSASSSSYSSSSRRGRRIIHTFSFPLGSPLLARVCLRGLHLSVASSPSSSLVSSLEVINLHSVTLTEAALRKVVAACPLLRSLDLRCCRHLRRIDVAPSSLRFSSLVVIDCTRVSELRVSSAPRLRSFRYSGSFLSKYSLGNSNSSLEDVYFCSGGPEVGLPPSNWFTSLGHLSNLKILTLCSVALQYISALSANAIGELRNFRSLTELQLLMLGMANSNLTDIYSFLRTCRCPRLERLFVQLPTNTHDPFTENFLELVEEEPPEDGFENLKIVKMRNFKGHRNEMCLVTFLLRKASCLNSLVLVAPKEHVGEEFRKGPSDMHHCLKSQLLVLEKASKYAQIVLSEIDDCVFQPSHSEIYVKF